MPVTRSGMVSKIRLRLQDRSTRRDGTAITTPRFSDTDLNTVINDVIRDRQPLIAEMDKSWYRSTADYTASGETYSLPSGFKQWEELRRSDLSSYPIVPLIDYNEQDAAKYAYASLWSGFYAVHPENIAPAGSSAALLSTTQFRILPAPTSSMTYRLFYQRVPTEPTADSSNLDIPDNFQEVISLDAALYLASSVDAEVAGRIERQLALAIDAREREYQGRDAGRVQFGQVRF